MMSSRRIGPWFLATCLIFFTRALLFSSYVSRGPEVQAALHLDTATMGLLSMLYPAGGLAGIIFSSALVNRFGSKLVNVVAFSLACASFIALGPAIEAGNLTLSATLLFLVGFPMAISDYVGNLEGTGVGALSKRSLMPAIHGAFGLGMLIGASLASRFIDAGVGIPATFTGVALFVAAASILAGMAFTPRRRIDRTSAEKKRIREDAVKVWFEKRSLLIAVIGFSFIMAEYSAGTFVPIALTQIGFTGADAAFALGIFWILVTSGRILGGFIVGKIGRRPSVLISALLTAAGLLLFMGGATLNLPYVGLVFWGFGISLGMPMAVSSMGDDPKLAGPRVNMVVTMVYFASVTVGPILGSLGQSFGIFVAFGIPFTMMLITAAISGVTKPATAK